MHDAQTPPAVKPPDGCESTQQHERKFTELAGFCETFARELQHPKPTKGKRGRGRPKKPADPNVIVKLVDASIKARRAASSLARQREDDVEAARIEQLDEMVNGGAH